MNFVTSAQHLVFNFYFSESLLPNDYKYEVALIVFRMLVNPLSSFLTIMTFLYLFYFQGTMDTKRAEERSERNTMYINEILRGDFKGSKFFNPLLEEDD